MSQGVIRKHWFAIFKDEVTTKKQNNIIKIMTVSTVSVELLFLLQPNFVLWKTQECLVRRLKKKKKKGLAIFKVQVTAKLQNVNETDKIF